MNKHLIFTIFAIATLCMACDKTNGDVENGNTTSTNPYPYLRISDIEVYYGMNISNAEDLIFSKGYQGGYISSSYKYYKGNDTIYLGDLTSNIINKVCYCSSLQVQPSEARGWMLHPTQTYSGKYTYKFAEESVGNNWDSWQSYMSQLNSSEDAMGVWESETDNVTFLVRYCYNGFNGDGSGDFASINLYRE